MGFVPRSLPKEKMAPVGLRVGSKFGYADGSQPPALKEVAIDFDRNVSLDARSVPVCPRIALAQQVSAARRACGDSIVGSGIAHVAVPIISPEPISIPLTLFNGGARDGTSTLFIQTYLQEPTPAPLIAAVRIHRVERGIYGLRASVEIPSIANGTGSVLDYRFTIKRHIEHAGKESTYASARCSDRHLNARVESNFKDGTRITGTVIRTCSARQVHNRSRY